MMIMLLVVLVGLLAGAVGAGSYALVSERQRRAVLARASGFGDSLLLEAPRSGLGKRLAEGVARLVPAGMAARGDVAQALLHAGYDAPTAPAVYAATHLALTFGLPLLVLAVAPRGNQLYFVLLVVLAAGVGRVAPTAMVQRWARGRQEKLQHQLPDCLDLLVVCVEAGVSLDAAMQRVAREMLTLHPELSAELLHATRRVNAGMSRDQALEGMYERTGVQELRALVANMIQSDKWGTSIATVLRVYAEGLRRRRKQAAEKKAATAPLKMMGPLMLFIFPVIFIVLIGPAVLRISTMLDATH